MRLRCIMVALTFLAVFASDSWGQSSESPPQTKTEQKANETPASQPDTKTQDGKIEIAPIASPSPSSNHSDDKSAAEASHNSKEADEGTEYWVYRGYKVKITDGLLVLFTLGLVVIGALQAIFLRGTLIATADAAKAAQAAAEYIPVVEGAHVYVVIKREQFQDHLRAIGQMTASADFRPTIRIALKNFGKTPAFIERFSASLSLISTKQQISGPVMSIQPNTIIGTGDESDPPLIVAAPILSRTDAEEIWRASAAIVLGGTLIYRDILGIEWTAPFDGRFDNDTASFRLDNYPRQKNT